MAVVRVEINPEVLMWAVEYSQKGFEAFEKKFKSFPKWLNKTERPTIKQLENIAKFAYVPFGYLMLSEKPMIKVKPIEDFRTKKNRGFINDEEYSADLRDTLLDVRNKQDWLREYKEEQGYDNVRFVGSINQNMPDDDVVQIINKILNIDDQWRKNVKNKEEGFRFFLDMVEGIGVTVFVNGIVGNNTRRKLNVNEFRGFALTDKPAPVIFINGSDSPAARLFSLVHELVHLFLGQDGLDDHTEPFCNRIAAKVLVPKTQFDEKWCSHPNDFDALERFFKVSQLVLYRMALTLDKITPKEYERLIELYNKKFQEKKRNTSGGDFYNTVPYRLGRSFCQYVQEALGDGKLSYSEAYQLLGIRGKTFDNVMKVNEGRA